MEQDLVHEVIPIISAESIKEIDAFFIAIKPWFKFSPDDYQCWKMIKKAVPILHKHWEGGYRFGDNEMRAEFTLDSVQKHGYSRDIWGAMFSSKES